jgi:hypothetical protein
LTKKNLILPFVVKTQPQKEALTYSTELACVASMAEMQRKKASFLRDTPEKLSLISKVYYPLWIVALESTCLALDGLGLMSHKFTFKEPAKTAAFIEDLKKNSVSPQEFLFAMEKQVKSTGEFTMPANSLFKGLIAEKELLSFFAEYFKNGSFSSGTEAESGLIPVEVDQNAAVETSRAVANCLRTLQADAKGLQYALEVLREEVEFHQRAASFEIERLKEACETQTVALRPEVDKAVKKLTVKHDKALAAVSKGTDRKVAVLEKRREKYMRKLQSVEQKKAGAQKRRDTARKKSSGTSAYSSYALQKFDREISTLKKEIRAAEDALNKVKKEGDQNVKQLEEEFRKAVAAEEGKITTITQTCQTKSETCKKQIEAMASEAAAVTSNFENIMDNLKRSGDALRQQVKVDCAVADHDIAVLVNVPVYLIKYTKQKDDRYSLLSPMSITEEVGVLNGLRKMLTLSSEPRLKTLTRTANKNLQEMLTSNVIDKMQSDEVFRIKIGSVSRAANLLDRMEFAEILNQGLDDVVNRGWMTSEEASALCKRIMEDKA